MEEKKSVLNLARETVSNPKADIKSRFHAQYIINIDGQVPDMYKMIADNMNRASLEGAIASLFNERAFDWLTLTKGVFYPVIDTEATDVPVKMRTVKVSDVFSTRKTKNSKKREIPGTLFAMLEAFGVNVCNEYVQTRSEFIAKLQVYSKYTNAPDCFFCETASSVGKLEEQLQLIFNEMFSAENAPKAKKMYVRHLSDSFTKADKEGYRNGNAVKLLQVVVDHAQDALYNRKYAVKSGLASHKAPKERNKK